MLEIWLSPGLNLTIFRRSGPQAISRTSRMLEISFEILGITNDILIFSSVQ